MLLQIITQAAYKVGISAHILVSVCTVETGLKTVSNFNDPNGGSHGVCQVALPTARSIIPTIDLLALQNPYVNAYVAASYLKQLKHIHKETNRMLAAYNAGHVEFNDDGSFINQEYVDKVNNVMYNYKKR